MTTSRLFWPCLRTKGKHLGEFPGKLLQVLWLFSFLCQYTRSSLLTDLGEERQWKRLKALKQRHRGIENPPLNCRNGKRILRSPLLCLSTGSPVIPARDIYMLEKHVLVARDTMISSEGSQLPSLFSVTHTARPGEPVVMHVKSLFLIFCFCNMTYYYTTSSWGRAVWRTSVAVPAVRVLPLSDVSAPDMCKSLTVLHPPVPPTNPIFSVLTGRGGGRRGERYFVWLNMG